jgi:protein-tyrosine phosphatase
MVRVLFVCLGNICRSPMAEAVFSNLVREAGLDDKIEADSAGTGDWHLGERPHQGTRRILQENSIPYDGRARHIDRTDHDRFDYIVAMDNANLRDVRYLGNGKAQVVRLMDFAPQCGVAEVPDPYYDGRFELVYDLVSEAASGLLTYIRQELQL